MRLFFLLPFAHSENLSDQELSVRLHEPLGEPWMSHARGHREIVRRFGRFPHRNVLLGHLTTPEERAFLDADGFAGWSRVAHRSARNSPQCDPMDKLDQYRVFVQVAEKGSFIRAAHALELPRASVSAAVQQLETSVGTRLLHRTTRAVHLTTDGALLLERLRALLSDVGDVDQLFQARERPVSGRLNVDVPSRIARRLIAPSRPTVMRRHPRLVLGLGSTDRAIDPAQEGVDCAVRVGSVQVRGLALRPIGRFALINCLNPAYLHEHDTHEESTTSRKVTWRSDTRRLPRTASSSGRRSCPAGSSPPRCRAG